MRDHIEPLAWTGTPPQDAPSLPTVKIVALIGPKQSGKTTVATELQTEYGFARFRFADALKRMIEAIGIDREHIDGCKKEVPLDVLCGKSTRYAMQTLGTEWRNMIGKCLWAKLTVAEIKNWLASQGPFRGPVLIVVDDARFLHEIDTLKEDFSDHGEVEVWRIYNPKVRYPYRAMWLARRAWGRVLLRALGYQFHESEAWWPVLPADHVIENDGTLDELYEKVWETATRSGMVRYKTDPDKVRRIKVRR